MIKKDNREVKLEKVVVISKLALLFFIGGICLTILMSNSCIEVLEEGIIPNMILVLVWGNGALYLYWSWHNGSERLYSKKASKRKVFIQNGLIISACTLIIMVTGGAESSYMILFLPVILLVIVEAGIGWGLRILAVSAGILFSINYIMFRRYDVVFRFEREIVMITLCVMVAYLLSFYIKLEKESADKVKDALIHDQLTGAYNHHYLQNQITKFYEEKSDTPTYVLLVDIDKFNAYNEQNGYTKGDSVLKLFPFMIEECIQGSIISRYGGDQFAVLVIGKSKEETKASAETLRVMMTQTYMVGEDNLPTDSLTLSIGISDSLNKVKEKKDFLGTAQIALQRAKLLGGNSVETYIDVLAEIQKNLDEEETKYILELIDKMYKKDEYTYKHGERLVKYSKAMARALELSEKEEDILIKSAYLHDIGKVKISKELLQKKGPLTSKEWEILVSHSKKSVEIIEVVPTLKECIPVILHHHERYDGTGYPGRLREENIPYLARILTIIDSFDAMTHDRPYRKKISYMEAIEELEAWSGAQFDPRLVQTFKEIIVEMALRS